MPVKENSFINIGGWMVTDLGLRGDKLTAYAIVYGFGQDNAGWYTGGREYLSDWLGCSLKKAGRILNELVDEGLVVKCDGDKTNGGLSFRYKAVDLWDKTSLGDETSPTLGTKRPVPTGQNVPNLRDKTSHRNTKGDSKSNGKEKNNSDLGSMIDEYTDNECLRTELREFVAARKASKKAMTSHALRLNLDKLDKLATTDDEKAAIVSQSIERGWQGLFELKQSKPQSKQQEAYEPSDKTEWGF